MRTLDWIVLLGSMLAIALYGVWRGRQSKTVSQYLLAGKTMPWYAMALSIMATQASAITFISTTGQAYTDGMRFVQFYFGLPIAMVILSATAVPLFHRSGVYTAYEYLEKRFDSRVRFFAAAVFLIQRGLGVGIALSAPAILLSVLLGWPDGVTTTVMGVIVIAYTVAGGIEAVTWTDVYQMLIIFAGLVAAFITVIVLLPDGVGFTDALALAGAAGKLNVITTAFDPNDRYNLWSGLIGGAFLALAYFGCDQSQVQRYLTGKSIAQSKLGLLFNAAAKIPMQFFILLTGALVFSFYIFVKPPASFQPAARKQIEAHAAYGAASARYNAAFERRREAAEAMIRTDGEAAFHAANAEFGAARAGLVALASPDVRNDTNYIFLTFVTEYLPAGLVGLVMAAIIAAAMSTISGEVNSLATVTVIDLYQRHVRAGADDRHYLAVSRWATAFWGLYAVVFAQFARNLGSLIEVVNLVGSYFYGTLLGVFVLAFFFKSVGGRAAFWGMAAGQSAVLAVSQFTSIAFLWYNAIAPAVVVVAAVLLNPMLERKRA